MWHPENFYQALVSAAAFGLLGLVLTLLGFKCFDWITPQIDVQRELTEHKNVAVAIVVGAVIVAVSLVVGKAISG